MAADFPFDREPAERPRITELEDMPSGDLEDLQRSPHLAYMVLYTHDVDELAEFYEGVFQFARSYETGTTVELQAGPTSLAISDASQLDEVAGLHEGPGTRPATSATFLVENVDEVYEAALALGAESLRAPHDTEWGMRSAWVRDPAGHLIELGRWLRPG